MESTHEPTPIQELESAEDIGALEKGDVVRAVKSDKEYGKALIRDQYENGTWDILRRDGEESILRVSINITAISERDGALELNWPHISTRTSKYLDGSSPVLHYRPDTRKHVDVREQDLNYIEFDEELKKAGIN